MSGGDDATGSLLETLSPDERARLNDLLRHPSYLRTPELLLDTWQRLVAQVEGGYNDIVDEYVHALTCRDLLEDAISLVPPRKAERTVETVKPWDLRFSDATRGLPKPIHQRRSGPVRWWFYRIPARQGSRFQEHLEWWLEAEGSLPEPLAECPPGGLRSHQ